MTNQVFQEFFDSTAIDGALSPEQAAALMALAEQGDTVAKAPDAGGVPATTTAKEDATEDKAGDKAGEQAALPTEGEKPPVLLAKDGVHTIDYQKLVEARQGEQHWRAQAEAAQQELEGLRAAAQTRADEGKAPTQADNMVKVADAAIAAGADLSLFGDFSEEAMAKGIQQLVSQQVAAEVGKAVKPLQERHEQTLKVQEQTEADAHRNAVLTAHPDAVSIWQSTELQAWIGAKPGYEQAAIRGVLEGGEAADLIAVFGRYKVESGITPATTPAAPNPKAAAKAAIEAAEAKDSIPASLSGIPGGRAGGTTVHDQMGSMDTHSLAAAMNGMSEKQVEAFLNRQI